MEDTKNNDIYEWISLVLCMLLPVIPRISTPHRPSINLGTKSLPEPTPHPINAFVWPDSSGTALRIQFFDLVP
jgi:hypothetical protein